MNEITNKVFTESTDGINASVNQLEATCITSKTNKFHLDSEGNLSVNSITTVVRNPSSSIDFNMIYPIGVVYISIVETNPGTMFGGTWERLAKGKTLVGLDEQDVDFNVVEKVGGSKYLQKHSHGIYGGWKDGLSHNIDAYNFDVSNHGNVSWKNYGYYGTSTEGTGNSGNLQPYLVVYMWKRVA